jgi:hypothetical protein
LWPADYNVAKSSKLLYRLKNIGHPWAETSYAAMFAGSFEINLGGQTHHI